MVNPAEKVIGERVNAENFDTTLEFINTNRNEVQAKGNSLVRDLENCADVLRRNGAEGPYWYKDLAEGLLHGRYSAKVKDFLNRKGATDISVSDIVDITRGNVDYIEGPLNSVYNVYPKAVESKTLPETNVAMVDTVIRVVIKPKVEAFMGQAEGDAGIISRTIDRLHSLDALCAAVSGGEVADLYNSVGSSRAEREIHEAFDEVRKNIPGYVRGYLNAVGAELQTMHDTGLISEAQYNSVVGTVKSHLEDRFPKL